LNDTRLKYFGLAIFMDTIFFILFGALKQAFTNKNFIELTKLVRLRAKEVSSISRVDAENAEKELRDTFTLQSIDVSSLYFNFLEDGAKFNQTMERKNLELGVNHLNFRNQDADIIYYQKVTEKNLVRSVVAFERTIFEKKWLSQKTCLDDTKLFGYNLSLKLLDVMEKCVPAKILIYIAFPIFIEMIGSSLWILNEQKDQKSKNNNLLTPLMISDLLFSSLMIITQQNVFLEILLNIKRRKDAMLKLGELITPGKRTSLPNLNIFDEMSLRTWVKLRKVFMHFGERQLKVLSLIITLFLIRLAIAAIVFYISYLLDLEKETSNQTLKSCAILVIIQGHYVYLYLLALISIAITINQQYTVHRDLMMKNKEIVKEMYRLYPHYIANEHPLKPRRLFEDQALKVLKKEFPGPYDQEKMERKLKALIETYNNIASELQDEERKTPIKFFGFEITGKVFIGLATTFLPAIWGSVQTLIHNFCEAHKASSTES